MPMYGTDRKPKKDVLSTLLDVYDDEKNHYGDHKCRSVGTFVLSEIANRGTMVPISLCIDAALRARKECWCNIKQDY